MLIQGLNNMTPEEQYKQQIEQEQLENLNRKESAAIVGEGIANAMALQQGMEGEEKERFVEAYKQFMKGVVPPAPNYSPSAIYVPKIIPRLFRTSDGYIYDLQFVNEMTDRVQIRDSGCELQRWEQPDEGVAGFETWLDLEDEDAKKFLKMLEDQGGII